MDVLALPLLVAFLAFLVSVATSVKTYQKLDKIWMAAKSGSAIEHWTLGGELAAGLSIFLNFVVMVGLIAADGISPVIWAYYAMANVGIICLCNITNVQSLNKIKSHRQNLKLEKQKAEQEKYFASLDPFSAEWAKYLQKLQESVISSNWISAKEQLLAFVKSQFNSVSSYRSSSSYSNMPRHNESAYELGQALEPTVVAAADMAIVFRMIELAPNHQAEGVKVAHDAFDAVSNGLMRSLHEWRASVSHMRPEVAAEMKGDTDQIIEQAKSVTEKLTDLEIQARRLTTTLGQKQFMPDAERRLAAVTAGLEEVNALFAPLPAKQSTATVELEDGNVRRLPLPRSSNVQERRLS